jgi:hypothetical protein
MVFDTGFFVMLFFVWGIPLGLVVWKYIYLSDEERKVMMKSFRSWQSISTMGLLTAGVFLLILWNSWNHMALLLLGISCILGSLFFIVLELWGKSKVSSITIVLLLSGLIFLYISEAGIVP